MCNVHLGAPRGTAEGRIRNVHESPQRLRLVLSRAAAKLCLMNRAIAFAALLAAASAASAQSVDGTLDRELPSLVETYKTFHAAPELSTMEVKTSAALAAQLRAAGFEVTEHVGKYVDPDAQANGVVAVLRNGSGPTILIRSDMDALPVKEETGLAYASSVRMKNTAGDDVPVMHACGHDVHMTTLIGTARVLAATKSQWHGTVVLVGQPAEEVVRGADAMLRDGIYTRFPKPDFAVALHDAADIEVGKVVYTPGYTMAGSDSINLTIRGVGGHGARPESTKDPVVLAAEFVVAAQTIVSRETSPLDSAVLTIGAIHGGTKRNVIPDEVQLLMTVRTFKPEVRTRILASIERIARGLAIAAGMPDDRMPVVEFVASEHVGPTWNDPALTERLAGALTKTLGAANVAKVDPLMVSEDFGRFGMERQIPTVLMSFGAIEPSRVAAANAAGTKLPSLHSSRFAPTPEMTIRTGVRAEVAMVFELLR
jgi:hippurate hydrolase